MKWIRKAAFVIKNNPLRVFICLIDNKLFNKMSDEKYLRIMYFLRMGKKLNLDTPQTFNEKLQWLKLNDRKQLYTKLVDKYGVREYISEKIGEEYLIPLLGVYDKFDDIDFDKLPKEFVLKCNHDSGGIVICTDKDNLDKRKVRKKIEKNLHRNFYYRGREWPYKNVIPKIVCEKYMVDESGYELKDYKILCFNGKAKCLFVCLNRNSKKGLNVDFYDMNWERMKFERHYTSSQTLISKPHGFEKMVNIAETLAEGFPFVRVDLYEINGQIYFGELTFFPGSGFEKFNPDSYDELLGSWIDLGI